MVYNWINNEQPCTLCDEPSQRLVALCAPCEEQLPWLGPHCIRCALPLSQDQLICGPCLKRPPGFSQVIAPWHYGFPIDSLISRFKHQANWPYGRVLGELLARHIQHALNEFLPRPDLLLAVPLSPRRQRQRGFNQAQMLADWIGPILGLPRSRAQVKRVKDTAAQQQLDAKSRQRNLRNAFIVTPDANFSGQHIAIVDDVLTTGATANSLAHSLLHAGARRVDVYCLARTPKPAEQ